MTDPAAAADMVPDSSAAAPEASERGRYAVFLLPDGGLVIARSAPLCDRCASCGCGEQLEPLRAPAMLVNFARSAANGQNNLRSAVMSAAGEAGLLESIRMARRGRLRRIRARALA